MEIYPNQSRLIKPKKGYIKLSTLTLFAFSSAFFSRVLQLLKFPSIVNLLHLAIVPWLFAFSLWKTKIKDRQQITIIKEMVVALFIFMVISVASALLNAAGLINIAVNFLLLCEHFLFIVIILTVPITLDKLNQLRGYIVFASFTNLAFAYVQQYVLHLHLRQGLEDNIKGVFIAQGAGHVIGASVSLTFGIYYFLAAKNLPIWLRAAVVLATFWHMVISDAKQVILVFGIAGGFLLLTKFKNMADAIKFVIIFGILSYVFWWAIHNVPEMSAFQTWMRPEIYGPEGEATLLKSATFRIVPAFYESPLHPLLGLGPGHTVGRLGGWMLREYAFILRPLGATSHPATNTIWQAVGASWLGDQSSMFSPLFGWAGIWGDVGFLGLASFLYIWFVVWRRLCFDDISKFLVLCPLSFGLIFTQMEEPGYMIYLACIVVLRWQEYHFSRQSTEIPQPPRLTIKTLLRPQVLLRALLLIG
ncbi:MAG: hypothetical protein P5694_00455 [Limnospira sp. PMC 1286.21]|uniref:hypothetical protein n=1 Tax=unclassified Limnospira TaxID=2642885 RepID=UPI0028E0ECF1|nr:MULTISPECIES: hypothetical protein [unclassified Limnospira]MDT9298733.1 hypothetical protein [Limnospira sp. PMC 1281.21]MDT9319243.1 hypothetical protein [Limnospira sp. PMC 1290.21]MDT9324196.1 hypothetical protein [Limnospira sp. PMC 1286.21]